MKNNCKKNIDYLPINRWSQDKRPREKLSWEYENLIDCEISDVRIWDIDGDGSEEIITIEPFHGNNLVIYKSIDNNIDNKWVPIKWVPIYNYEVSLGHVIWAGKIFGKNGLIIGNRKNRKDLFCLINKNNKKLNFNKVIIDEGGAPAQIAVIRLKKHLLILVANNSNGEVALYIVSE